jgi:DoxX-like protein
MMLAADVLPGVLALVFGSAAVAKFVGQKQQVRTAEKLRLSWRQYRWIGVPEAVASAGLLVGYASAPLAAAAASGLVLLMAGALAFRIRVRDSVGFLAADATLLGLAASTAVLLLTVG